MSGGASPGTALLVAETLGQRRYGYPVTLDLPLPRGAARDTSRVALLDGLAPLPGVQCDVLARWPDGSLQWVCLSFNLSPGPLEERPLRLALGAEVDRPEPGPGVVEETEEAFLVRGVYAVPRCGPHFLASVRYGAREFLRAPAGFSLAPAEGPAEPLREAPGGGCRLLSPGPVRAVVERCGAWLLPGGRELPYRLRLAQPNSKSWFEAEMQIEAPLPAAMRLRLLLPYLLESLPARCDFGGIGEYLYGRLPEGAGAELRLRRDGWRLEAVPFAAPAGSAPAPEALSTSGRPGAAAWAHLLDGAPGGRAVALGSPDLAEGALVLSAGGDAALEWALPAGSPARLRALAHHVFDPVPVTAVTGPAAMLCPLAVTLPESWYGRCGAGRAPPR